MARYLSPKEFDDLVARLKVNLGVKRTTNQAMRAVRHVGTLTKAPPRRRRRTTLDMVYDPNKKYKA